MSYSKELDEALKNLAQALQVVVNEATKKPDRSKFRISEWANTPFVVTLLGGLLGTALTLTWSGLNASSLRTADQRRATIEARKVDLQREYDRKYAMIVQFANDFPGALIRRMNYKYGAIKFANIAATPNPDKETVEKFDAALVENRKLEDKLGRAPIAQSFTPQIVAMFKTRAVLEQANALTASLQRMSDATDKHVVDEEVRTVNRLYDSLLESMQKELSAKQPPQTNEET